MIEERRRILDMLAEGKISAADADGLLGAMSDTAALPPIEAKPDAPKSPKYLRVQVEDHEGERARVNICVPFTLLRAGCG